MSWKNLLSNRLVQTHKSSREEIQNLRALIKRDLEDAKVLEVSIDRRFAMAYGAAVNLARMATFCAGYRVLAVAGHHRTSFEAAAIALGSESEKLCTYFDTCPAASEIKSTMISPRSRRTPKLRISSNRFLYFKS